MKYCAFFLFLASMSAAAQQMVVAGPSGVPLQIEDEYGSWSIPITVYQDKDVDIMIQDVTSPGWIAWNSPGYLKDVNFGWTFTLFSRRIMSVSMSLFPQRIVKIRKQKTSAN